MPTIRRGAHTKILKFQVKVAQLVCLGAIILIKRDIVEPFGMAPLDIQTVQTPKIDPGILSSCPTNPTFLSRFLFWVETIQWEKEPAGCTSYLELCCDFIFSTKSYPPVPAEKFPNPKYQSGKAWVLVDDPSCPRGIGGYHVGQVV